MAELKTFLFTDICGSVRLKNEMTGRSVTERDLAFIQQVLTPHRERIERQLADYGGRVVSTAGDGHFLVFTNTIQAALWAVAVQESHRDEPITTPLDEVVEVRMSIHTGVPQGDPADPDNFVGKSVDYAARLNDYATGGQILVSRSVMAILDDVGLEGLRLHLHGRRPLKGIGNVEVHELLYDDHGPRRMRSHPKGDDDRQWTVIPTMGFEGTTDGGQSGAAHGGPPQRVGNYELQERLGAGGMGDVYKARHVQFDRQRAVKVIKPQFVGGGHEEVIRRFYNEIKAVGRLEHKNIVVAIDSSAPTDKIHYLVMEYIEGVGLDQLVAQHGPLSTADACEIVRQAARGLDYIHRNGMVHRDIKPSNLMLTLVDGDQVHSDSSLSQLGAGERGVVKILDLGLALLAEDNHDRFTRFDNKAMGTGMYMSPEQWKTTSVDIRADIYSLGCTLYHILAGNPPFFDSDLRPEKAHEKSNIPPIRTGGQMLPRKLWEVLRRMLAKRPEERYGSPADVAAALAPFAEGHDLPALYREFQEADPQLLSLTRMATPASQVDSWWSRMRGSSTDLLTSRRWWLSAALPLAVIIAAVVISLGVLKQSRMRAEADARMQLPAMAMLAADRKLPQAIEGRFQILTTAASDQEMIAALRRHNEIAQEAGGSDESVGDDAVGGDPSSLLEEWIKNLGFRQGDQVEANSWFINDRQGVQVARSPASDSIGNDYRTRDYFHGRGKNLSDDEVAELREPIEPIDNVHLSAVYKSDTSKNLKVAFSVPIRDSKRNGDPVIGVLAMSVNVAEFEVLDETESGSSQIVLIDLRPDSVGSGAAGGAGGLILHHPLLKVGELARLDAEWLERIRQTNPLKPGFNSSEHFLTDYRDPLSKNPNQRFWAAYEPVQFEYENARGVTTEKKPGWIVLAQKAIPE